MAKAVNLFTGRANQLPDPPEEKVQEAIVRGLTAYGYQVLVTSEHRMRVCCSPQEGGCGRWFMPHTGRRCSRGVPDLLVRGTGKHGTAKWEEFLGLEVKKGPNATVSPEQQALADEGAIVIVWTFEMALQAVQEYERRRGQ